jgi:hypothetical protein
MKDNQTGHAFGQYVRVSKRILNNDPAITGLNVEADLIARIITPVDDGAQHFVIVGFPSDEDLVCVDLIGYIGATEPWNLPAIDPDDWVPVGQFLHGLMGGRKDLN